MSFGRELPRIRRRGFVALALSVCGCASSRPSSLVALPAPPEPEATPVRVEVVPSAELAPEPTRVEAPRTPLLRAYPKLATLPWVDLGAGPTPVARATALEKSLGLGALYVKRDDLAGRLYGGSKVRKLEHLLADARNARKTKVITFGSAGSHHALATAIYARELGLQTVLYLLPEPTSAEVRAHLLGDLKAGAKLVLSPGVRDEEAAARALADREDALVLPRGGTSALGNVGFVNAAFELKEQIDAGALPEPDRIYIALGTMGAAVGLALGLVAAGLKSRVIAVRASSAVTSSAAHVAAAHAETDALLRSVEPSFPKVPADAVRLEIDAKELGAGYAQPTARGRRAIERAAESGLVLETTYTAKAMAGLIADAPGRSKEVILFWNTHNSKPISTEGADPRALPSAFRGYFP